MKIVVYVFIALSFLNACTSSAYKIKGKVEQKLRSSKVELVSIDNKKLTEAEIINGEFEIKGTTEKPDLFILKFPNDYIDAPVYLENKEYRLNLKNKMAYVIPEDKSAKQTEYVAFLKEKNVFDVKLRLLGNKYCSSKDMKEKVILAEQMDKVSSLQKELIFSTIKKFKGSVIAHYIAKDFVLFCERDFNMFTELIECFKGDNFDSDIKKGIIKKYEKLKASRLTGKAPDFELMDKNGNKVKLSSFKGKYVLLDFWASWCAPCRKKNKHLKKYYKEFAKKGFQFVSLSLDNDKSKWLKAVKEDNIPWIQLVDLSGFKDSEVRKLYKVKQVPTVYIIDPQGDIVKQNPSFEEIKELLNQ